MTFGANNSERAGNEVISGHLSCGCSFVGKNLGTRLFYRVKETHLLSRLIKVCLKETVERFHVFLFSKQHMIGQILQNLKRITNIKLSSHELATSYNLAKKGKQGIYSTTLFFKVNLEFGSVSFRAGGGVVGETEYLEKIPRHKTGTNNKPMHDTGGALSTDLPHYGKLKTVPLRQTRE